MMMLDIKDDDDVKEEENVNTHLICSLIHLQDRLYWL